MASSVQALLNSVLQRTNLTLRRLSEEMRSYGQEKSRQREEELRTEVERIQQEIKLLQRSSEESATVSDRLNREVELEGELEADRAAGARCGDRHPAEEGRGGAADPGHEVRQPGVPRHLPTRGVQGPAGW